MLSLLVCSSALALDANEEITPPTTPPDYLVLAQTWQPGFCTLKPKTAGCDNPPTTFLTHGIWPYNNSNADKTNRHPAFCNTAPSCSSREACNINEQKLDEIIQQPEFARLVPAEPQGMLRHEWSKHGSCAGKTEEAYFNDFIRLKRAATFDEKTFKPWIGGSVLFSTLKTAFPSNTSFRCFIAEGKQYLHEVFYLLNPDGSAYEDDKHLQIGTRCEEQQTYIPGGAVIAH